MDFQRLQLKHYLLQVEKQHWCPLCHKRGLKKAVPVTDLHEIISPPVKSVGGRRKYYPDWSDPDTKRLAEAIYVKYNCVLLCNTCNITIANSLRDYLILQQFERYALTVDGQRDPRNVIKALVQIGKLCKQQQTPKSAAEIAKSVGHWLPAALDWKGTTYTFI